MLRKKIGSGCEYLRVIPKWVLVRHWGLAFCKCLAVISKCFFGVWRRYWRLIFIFKIGSGGELMHGVRLRLCFASGIISIVLKLTAVGLYCLAAGTPGGFP